MNRKKYLSIFFAGLYITTVTTSPLRIKKINECLLKCYNGTLKIYKWYGGYNISISVVQKRGDCRSVHACPTNLLW